MFIRKFLVVVLLLLQPSLVNSQLIEWQNTIGGSSQDNLRIATQTADGGIICGGYSISGISGEKTEACQGNYDYWVVKLDLTGNIEWQNTIGGSGSDVLTSIIQTSDGGYLCGGSSQSGISGDKTEICLGSNDYWIVKLDALGDIQWQKTIGGSDPDNFSVLIQTTDGGYMLTGSSASNISAHKSENCIGLTDFWFVKTDQNGNIQWENTIGGSHQDWIESIQQTTDGGYICGGRSLSSISGDKNENNMGSFDYWVIKLDITGNIIWQNSIGGDTEDDLYSIKQTIDGGYICGGYSQSDISFDKTEDHINGMDYWVLKLDVSGNITWQNNIGGSMTDKLYSVVQLPDGNYIIGGTSDSPVSGEKTEKVSGNDFWILKLDQQGQIIWQNAIGGTQSEELYMITLTPEGNLLCAGSSGSSVSYDVTEGTQGSYDYWVVKLNTKINLITGELYQDNNLNNIFDMGEFPMQYKLINETNSGNIVFSNMSGAYTMIVNDTGNFQVEPESFSLFNVLPSVHTASFRTLMQTDSLNDFAFQSVGNSDDLKISLSATGTFRSVSTVTYHINYTNEGNTILSPEIVFYPDSEINFVSAFPAPTSITPDSIVFTPSQLNPFQTGYIKIYATTDPGLPGGTLINCNATILPVTNDLNPADNYSATSHEIFAAYDPNDKRVNRTTIVNTELANPPFLEYTIRFQNTGNDTAFYVRIDDKITGKLQLNTFEFIAASHNCELEYQAFDSTMKFVFNNILLPDSNANEPESHGFVKFRIKPQPTLAVGDVISNRALIYFDYHPPVITDTATTQIILSSGIQSATEVNKLKLYPNPVNDKITIELPAQGTEMFTMEIYNSYGQKISSFKTSGKSVIDVSGYASGIYFVKVTGKDVLISRFVVNN